MEILRRAVLLAGAFLLIGLTHWAVLRPLVSVRLPDFDKSGVDPKTWTRPVSAWAEEGAEREPVRHVSVSGAAWESFFAGAAAASAGREAGADWRRRVPKDERNLAYTNRTVFFRADEPVLAGLAERFRENDDRIYLELAGASPPAYLEATSHRLSNDDFRFGSGFSHRPKPPSHFVYPFRRAAPWIALLALAFYILLPRRRIGPSEIGYQSWRLILGDLAAMILFVPFFWIPLFVVGGAVQALTLGWPLLLVMWPLAFIGVWLLNKNAWYASYRLILGENGIALGAGGYRAGIGFGDIDHYRPLILKSPRWLILMSALAALGGRGGGAGRALILSGAAYNGLGFFRRDGSAVFLWASDMMGKPTMKNIKRLIERLEEAGIRREDAPLEIRRILPPDGAAAGGRLARDRGGLPLLVLFVLPVAAMAIFFLVAIIGRPF